MSQKNNLTAWERWELASLEDGGAAPKRPPLHAKVAPKVEPKIETTVVETPVAIEDVHIPTAEEIEQIHQQAHDTGYKEGYEAGLKAGRDEGYEAGHAEGHEKGRVKGEAAAEQLLALAGKLETDLAALDETVAGELVSLALEVAREVLRQTLSLQPEVVVGVVRDALQHLPHQHANIYLHPDDAALVRSYAGDQLSHAGHRIHEDARLQRNDVSIEAGGAHVDATVATRWRRVVETLGRDVAWDGKTLPPLPAAPTPEPVLEPSVTPTVPQEPAVAEPLLEEEAIETPPAIVSDESDLLAEAHDEAETEPLPDSVSDEGLSPEFSADLLADLTDDTPLPGVDTPDEAAPPEEEAP